MSLTLSGCEDKVKEPQNGQVNLSVRVSEISYNFARITVRHDGPEDITWYGFLTRDVTTNEFDIFFEKYSELVTSGKALELKKEQEMLQVQIEYYNLQLN